MGPIRCNSGRTKMHGMGPSILFCGDPHGSFGPILEAARQRDFEAVVILGDLDLVHPLEIELGEIASRLWFIPGNHDSDTDDRAKHFFESGLADRNIHGRVVELPSGLHLAGLGGVFRGTVWHPGGGGPPTYRSRTDHARSTPRKDRWRGVGPPRRHLSTIYPDDIAQLSSMRADVLVTHEAPGYHAFGFEVLDDLARAMCVRVVVHGHHHDALDSSERWAAQGFRSYGVGLRGLTAIDDHGLATVVRPGE